MCQKTCLSHHQDSWWKCQAKGKTWMHEWESTPRETGFFSFLFFFVIWVSVPQQPIFYTGFIFTKTPTFSIRIKIAIYQCYFDLNFACFWLLLTLSWYLKSIWRTLMDGKGQRGTISDLVITCNCLIHFLFEKVNSKICLFTTQS